MTAVSAAIVYGYLGIRATKNNLLIAAFCANTHVAGVIVYCGTFHRASRLRELQQKLRCELKMVSGKISSERAGRDVDSRKGTSKAVDALSCPGLRVGVFHEIERQSALIFIDFVESQLIGLLVTF